MHPTVLYETSMECRAPAEKAAVRSQPCRILGGATASRAAAGAAPIWRARRRRRGPFNVCVCVDGGLLLLLIAMRGRRLRVQPQKRAEPDPQLRAGLVLHGRPDADRRPLVKLPAPARAVDFERARTNDVDLFDGTAASEGAAYLYDNDFGIETYGLLDGTGVGVTVNNTRNLVTQKNRGECDLPTCEPPVRKLDIDRGAA